MTVQFSPYISIFQETLLLPTNFDDRNTRSKNGIIRRAGADKSIRALLLKNGITWAVDATEQPYKLEFSAMTVQFSPYISICQETLLLPTNFDDRNTRSKNGVIRRADADKTIRALLLKNGLACTVNAPELPYKLELIEKDLKMHLCFVSFLMPAEFCRIAIIDNVIYALENAIETTLEEYAHKIPPLKLLELSVIHSMLETILNMELRDEGDPFFDEEDTLQIARAALFFTKSFAWKNWSELLPHFLADKELHSQRE